VKKFNSSRNIIIALSIVILIVLVISFSAKQRDDKKQSLPGQSEVNSVVATIDNVVKAPFRGIENMVKSVNNLFNTYSENDSLKNSWQDVLIINKGKKDGIEVNMAVMGNKGLIGRVIIAEENSSKVELLTTVNQTTNHFPVMVKGTKGDMVYGLMEAYNNKTHTLVVSQLTSTDEIEVGSLVTTSGLGNNSPKGLLIGEVKEVKKNKTGLTNEVMITPLADMYDVNHVTVVKRLAGSTE